MTGRVGPAWILAAFCAGFAALLSQVVLARELLVVFFGHELTLGVVYGVWLLFAALGSALGKILLRLVAPERLAKVTAVCLIAPAVFSLPMLLVARSFRLLFGAPAGEFLSFGAILAGCVITLAPLCAVIGIIFPCLCQAASSLKKGAVARVYAADACGSLLGGLLFTFVFASRFSSLVCMFVVSAASFCAAACVIRSWTRYAALATVFFLVIAALWPGALKNAEHRAALLRWHAFGVLGNQAEPGAPRLLKEQESRYQNLALIESDKQATLYGNGQALFSTPDRLVAEFTMHFAMCQNPAARRVLLLGGNPADDVSVLLGYPLESLVYVDLDEAAPGMFDNLPDDSRLERIAMDGPTYLRRATNVFDAILVQAPTPLTVGLNRYFTAEFFDSVRRHLAPDGFFTIPLEASEHLHDDTALLSAAVWRTLKQVFPETKVTAAPMLRFFAGHPPGGLTLEPSELCDRSAVVGIQGEYFRPEYFEQDEALDEERAAWTFARLEEINAPINTGTRPVAFRYALVLWSRFSDSGLENILRWFARFDSRLFLATCLALGLAFLAVGVLSRFLGKRLFQGSARWPVAMTTAAFGMSGFTVMALHLMILVYFQNRFGFMYARIGLLTAVFMGGLALGAFLTQGLTKCAEKRQAIVTFVVQALLALAVLALLGLAQLEVAIECLGMPEWALEGLLVGLVIVLGGLAGMRFPAGCGWLAHFGLAQGSAAAVANAADLAGAALGSLATGLVLLSALGLDGACMLLAALQAAACLAVASGIISSTRRV